MMKTGVLILLILSVAAGQVMVFLEQRQKKETAFFVKTAASLFFVCAGLAALCGAAFSAQKALIMLGLILGMLGDIFLSGPSISRGECANSVFMAGGTFFGLGHLAYLGSLLMQSRSFHPLVLFIAAALIALTWLPMKSGFWKVEASQQLSFGAYGGVSGLLLAGAVNLVLGGAGPAGWIFFAASWLFVLSDYILATSNFSRFRSAVVLKYLCIFLYYLAQAGFVWGLGIGAL